MEDKFVTEEELTDALKDFKIEDIAENRKAESKSDERVPNYSWDSNAQFTIDGASLERLLQNHQAYLSQPQAQEVLAMVANLDILTNILKNGIADGSIKEQ